MPFRRGGFRLLVRLHVVQGMFAPQKNPWALQPTDFGFIASGKCAD